MMPEPIAERAFAWFAGLERENAREYFARTRDVYEGDVRAPLEALLAEAQEQLGGEWKVFRPQRDLRFSPDKRPYKDRAYGVLGRPGRGYYAEISARGLYAGTGAHQLEPDRLARYRAAVDDDTAGATLEAACAAVEAAGLELAGAALRTAPRGFPRDHPRIALLRRKALFAGRRLPPGDIADPLAFAIGTWSAAEPLNAWLDAHT